MENIQKKDVADKENSKKYVLTQNKWFTSYLYKCYANDEERKNDLGNSTLSFFRQLEHQ